LAAGVPAGGVADRYVGKSRATTLTLRDERVEQLLGVSVDSKSVQSLLSALGLKTQRQNKAIKVTLSPRRPDLTREADLIEELARIRGYQHIPTTMPSLRASGGSSDIRLASERRVRCFLSGADMVEVINLPFVTEELNRTFPGVWPDPSTPVAVLNPLAKESAEMRLSLLPGLITNLQENLAHNCESFHAFHLGKVFRRGAGGSEERVSLAGLLYGPRAQYGLREKDRAAPGFLDVKGILEALFDLFHLRSSAIVWRAANDNWLHPGKAASVAIEGRRLGCAGQIHPEVSERVGVAPFVLFELDFENLLQYAPRQITAQPLPRFPSVERDFAVIVDRNFPAQQIVGWIENLGESLIEQVEVFDQYLGAPIPEGKKSLAYKILYRAEDRTLTDAEINTLHQNLVQQIGDVFGVDRR